MVKYFAPGGGPGPSPGRRAVTGPVVKPRSPLDATDPTSGVQNGPAPGGAPENRAPIASGPNEYADPPSSFAASGAANFMKAACTPAAPTASANARSVSMTSRSSVVESRPTAVVRVC